MADQTIEDRARDILKRYSHMEELKWAADGSNVFVEKITSDDQDADVMRVGSKVDTGSCVILKIYKNLIQNAPTDIHERLDFEFKIRNKFHDVSSGCVAKPFFFDKKSAIVCIENLDGYDSFRTNLINGHLEEAAAIKVARDIAKIHRHTHVNLIGQEALEQMAAQFSNKDAMNRQERSIFTAPFVKDDPSNRCSEAVRLKLDWVYGDGEVTLAAADMKQVFLSKKEALIHGDLHTGSIVVKEEDSKLINLVHSRVGPCSFDIGVLIANYIFAYYCHQLTPGDNNEHRMFTYKIVEICNKSVDEYFETMTSCPEDIDTFQAKFISEVAGFAGCEIIRRVVGSDHVPEFEHTHNMEVDTLGAGVRLLKAYHRIHSVGTLMLIALMLA